MSDNPVSRYHRLIKDGVLIPDDAQERAAVRLGGLTDALVRHAGRRRVGLPGFRRRRPSPRGLYLWGDVGRGKSMLMDMFFASVPMERKRRVHFHAFMADVHERLFVWRENNADAGDPIAPVADDLAHDAALLCFDEFQVNDITDASILMRLFERLFDRGVVMVATSNRPPDDLYHGGLNRHRFLPCIALIKERMDVMALEASMDYRLDRLKGRPVWFQPPDETAQNAMDGLFAELTHGAAQPAEVAVKGRRIQVPAAGMGVARFSFADLCRRPLAAADYIALALAYHTMLVDGIPVMEPEQRNEAARFIMLIDALYEHKVKLIASAAAPPEGLYRSGSGADAFRRTASRLREMQSLDWLAAGHAVSESDASCMAHRFALLTRRQNLKGFHHGACKNRSCRRRSDWRHARSSCRIEGAGGCGFV